MVNTSEIFKIFILEDCIHVSATLLKGMMKQLLACELPSLVKIDALGKDYITVIVSLRNTTCLLHHLWSKLPSATSIRLSENSSSV